MSGYSKFSHSCRKRGLNHEFINKVVTAVKESVITVNQQIINERTPAERELIVKAIHDCCATKALMSETMIEKVIAFAIAKKVKEETIAASVTSFALLEMYNRQCKHL